MRDWTDGKDVTVMKTSNFRVIPLERELRKRRVVPPRPVHPITGWCLPIRPTVIPAGIAFAGRSPANA